MAFDAANYKTYLNLHPSLPLTIFYPSYLYID